ncbi:MAG: SAM hydrolase/SAM-dependent halogenase family protein [Gemmatimonadota bacterium]
MVRVTLLTDFGTADGYAAAMAGVVAAQAPAALVEHASHEIPPGDVFGAALALFRYADRYPEGTVHVVVVDPGVGTERRALAARVDGRYFVAPDNGVLTLVLQAASRVALVEVEDPGILADSSATFHGRDIFAPAAARLARGEPLETLGRPLRDPALLSVAQPERTPDGVRGAVMAVDRFGNLITNIPAHWLAGETRVTVDGESVGPLLRTYGDVESGEVVALVGSLDLLEVSVRDGSAAERLGAGPGTPVVATGSGA